MAKYLIKITSIGTEHNPNFAGVSNTYYSGKGSLTNIGRDVFVNDVREGFLSNALKRLAMEYGYTSESSAKCGLKSIKRFHNDTNYRGYHTYNYEIVEIKI